MNRLEEWFLSIEQFLEELYNKSSDIGRLYFYYILCLGVITFIYRIKEAIKGKRRKAAKHVRKQGGFTRILLTITFFLTIIAGSLNKEYISNILPHFTVMFLLYFLTDTIFIQHAKLNKIFNTEVVYEAYQKYKDNITESIELMEKIHELNTIEIDIIEITNRFLRTKERPKDIEQADKLLKSVTKDYIEKENLKLSTIKGNFSDAASFREALKKWYINNQISVNEVDVDILNNSLHRGEISQLSPTQIAIPVIGFDFSQCIILRGEKVIEHEAVFIKELASLIY